MKILLSALLIATPLLSVPCVDCVEEALKLVREKVDKKTFQIAIDHYSDQLENISEDTISIEDFGLFIERGDLYWLIEEVSSALDDYSVVIQLMEKEKGASGRKLLIRALRKRCLLLAMSEKAELAFKDYKRLEKIDQDLANLLPHLSVLSDPNASKKHRQEQFEKISKDLLKYFIEVFPIYLLGESGNDLLQLGSKQKSL